MAKNVARTEEQTNVAAINPGGPAALTDEMRQMYEEDAGVGVSTKAEDRRVPFVNLLQKGSPQVIKQHPDYVPGAEAGMFWIKGEEPVQTMWVQPLVMRHFYKEWYTPRGSGIAGTYTKLPEGAVEVKKKNQVVKWTMPGEASEVIETRDQFVNILGENGVVTPAIISFTGTGHGVWKDWNNTMTKKRQQNGALAPSYSNIYQIGSRWVKRGEFDWFQLVVLDSRWLQPEEIQLVKMGRELTKQILAGERTGDETTLAGGGEEEEEKIPF